jgi:hypothetical protein
LATLSGLAERDVEADTDSKMKGKTVSDVFITKTVNTAGCYALKFVLDGDVQTVVVDDWLPMKKDKVGKTKLAFAKGRKERGSDEIWMALIEKAFAKITGSYE